MALPRTLFTLLLLVLPRVAHAEPAVAIGSVVHPATSELTLPVTKQAARSIVLAAWRASGIEVDDERIDGMLTRAHTSALLPDVHLRAARRIDDEVYGPTPADVTYSYAYPDRVATTFEARLTWKLERLVYSNQEPALERLRLERSDTRARIAARVLNVLADWQHAWVDLHTTPPDAPASLDAVMRQSDAEASLDVMTAGYFSRWRARTSP